jgi:hypothetical protein
VTLRARGRGASSRTSQEEGESKPSAATESQQPPSCQQQDDDELPLARVRDDALARKACLSFAYCYLIKGFLHIGHQVLKTRSNCQKEPVADIYRGSVTGASLFEFLQLLLCTFWYLFQASCFGNFCL